MVAVPADESLLLRAIVLARSALEHGNHPFGALLVTRDGTVVLEAQNTVVTESDATGHAETNLVRLASRGYDRATLAGMALYTSTEPCAMCAGAIYWSGVGTVVFALSESALASFTGEDPENPTMSLPCREVFAHGRRLVQVRGPYPLDQASEVHRGFWRVSA